MESSPVPAAATAKSDGPTSTPPTELSVGAHYRAGHAYVAEREKIREFARAVQDTHPFHWSEKASAEGGHGALIAPLTFFSVPGLLTQTEVFESFLSDYELSQVMQTDQVVRYHRPVHAGDAMVFDVYLDSFRRAFGGDLIGFKNVVSNQHGQTMLISRTSIVARSAVDANLADLGSRTLMHGFRESSVGTVFPNGRSIGTVAYPPTRADDLDAESLYPAGPFTRPFATVLVGTELPTRTVRLRLGDLVNYAGVSGDPNPIHWSDEAAGVVRLEAPVAHGMLTIGIGAGYITNWLGDPAAVREYAVRLTSPVYVTDDGADVTFQGRVKSVDAARKAATIALIAKQNGRKIFGRATAVVQLA